MTPMDFLSAGAVVAAGTMIAYVILLALAEFVKRILK